jgi:hypothetical protein
MPVEEELLATDSPKLVGPYQKFPPTFNRVGDFLEGLPRVLTGRSAPAVRPLAVGH